MSDDDLEIYVYEGKAGERIPESAQHLIVKDGVRIVPEDLCLRHMRLRKVTFPDGLTRIGQYAFDNCRNLLEINKIPVSVHTIGIFAFNCCDKLKKVEFEDRNGTSPPQLKMIQGLAFEGCRSLERVKLTSSVSIVGEHAFCSCNVLVEANLSATCLTEIQDRVFADCTSLLTVGLPSTITRIGAFAFYKCLALVTVVVPFDSQSIMIEEACFAGCIRLANIRLPPGSTVEDYESEYEPFRACRVLRARFGDGTTIIVTGLVSRFDAYPIHRLCYDHSRTIHRLCYDHSRITVQELRQCITDQQEWNSVVDEFGMSPLHVFFSTSEPSGELLDVLLASLPYQLIQRKDVNGKRPLDYLLANWTDGNASLFQITVQNWVIDRLARWGAMSWMEAMQSKVQEILSQQDKAQRSALSDELLSVFEHYSNVEAISMLELALWKAKLRSGWIDDDISKRQAVDREEWRCVSGSHVVIPNVWKFLHIAPQA